VTDKKQKIIYVVTKGNWGGAQRYVFDLAKSLPKNKFDVLVLSGEGNILDDKLSREDIRFKKIDSFKRDVGILKELISFLNLIKIFLRENPDTIHLNSSKAGGLGAVASRVYQLVKFKKDLKIIFTVHGWAFNEEKFNNLLTRFLSWITVALSTKTIVISEENHKQALSFPLLRNKFVLIHNGISSIDFKDRGVCRKLLSEKTNFSENDIWLGTISELHKNKGLDYLIEAVSKMTTKPHVVIIGEGEERKNLEEKIKKLNLNEYIKLVGFLDEANSYLKAFDVFTLTSLKEGHPYALLEAGLARLPVVVSNISGVRDIVKDKYSGLLTKPKDSNSIKNSLEEILRNKEKMAQYSLNLEKFVKDKFDLKGMLEKTIFLYQS
jgi:glycosyltransferase involved in cell wall biosynthesis